MYEHIYNKLNRNAKESHNLLKLSLKKLNKTEFAWRMGKYIQLSNYHLNKVMLTLVMFIQKSGTYHQLFQFSSAEV